MDPAQELCGTAQRLCWNQLLPGPDPRTGYAHFAGLHRARGMHDFDSPAGDWVLVLDDAGLYLEPPGAQRALYKTDSSALPILQSATLVGSATE